MASSSAGAMGVGSATSLITVQYSGSDGRKWLEGPRTCATLVGLVPVASGCGSMAGADSRGHNRILVMRDLATADPRSIAERKIKAASLELEPGRPAGRTDRLSVAEAALR